MNRNTVVLQINGAIDALRGIQSTFATLPERQQRKIGGLAHLASVIHGLEVARAEVTGEPVPVAHSVAQPDDADLLDIIER